MKNGRTHINQRLLAAVFIALLVFPIGMKASHVFNTHEHVVCHELESHLHQSQLECSICDFHFSTFSFTPAPFFLIFDKIDLDNPVVIFKNELSNTLSIHFFLRGPPLLT